MLTFLLIWDNGKKTTIEGPDIGAAFVRHGYWAADFLKVKSHLELSPKEAEVINNHLKQIG
jgi:hypothetical protein